MLVQLQPVSAFQKAMSKVWRRLWLVTREGDWLNLVVSVERGSASVRGRALCGVKGDFRVAVRILDQCERCLKSVGKKLGEGT
jgi:hypothetical protein